MSNTTTAAADYKNLVDLIAIYKEGRHRLAVLETELDADYTQLVENVRAEYAELQASIAAAEESIRTLVKAHPEWFADAKTVKTPDGAVQSRTTTHHEAPDEVSAIARIKAAQARAIKAGNEVLATQLGALVRVEETLNLDAAGELSVEDLARFGIVRIVDESVTVKEAKLDLGKAVRTIEKREAKAAKEVAK